MKESGIESLNSERNRQNGWEKVLTQKWRGWPVVAISVVLLILMQAIPLLRAHNPIFPDSGEYLSLSKSLYHIGTYTFMADSSLFNEKSKHEPHSRVRQPFYPLYLLLTYWIPGQRPIIPIIGQIIMNIVVFLLMCSIGLRVFGKSFWPGTPLLLLFPLPFWLCSGYLLTEPLYIFWQTFALLSFVRLITVSRPRLANAILLGIFMGAAILTRPTGLLSAFFFILYIAARKFPNKENFTAAAIVVGSLAVILFPWTLRNYMILGDCTFLSSEGAENFWLATLPKNGADLFTKPQFIEAVGDRYYISKAPQKKFMEFAFQNIKSHPLDYFGGGVLRVFRSWCRYADFHVPLIFHIAQCLALILATIGFRRHFHNALFLGIPIAAVTVGMYLVHAEARFTWSAMPIILLLAGQGIGFLIATVKRPKPKLINSESNRPAA